jgi:hypothetical protein
MKQSKALITSSSIIWYPATGFGESSTLIAYVSTAQLASSPAYQLGIVHTHINFNAFHLGFFRQDILPNSQSTGSPQRTTHRQTDYTELTSTIPNPVRMPM